MKAALMSVVDSMDATAKQFRRQKYAPKPKPQEEKKPDEPAADESVSELAQLLGG